MFPRKSVRNEDGSRKKQPETGTPKDNDAERGAARKKATGFSMAYLKSLHRQVAGDSLGRIFKTPFASFLNCMMIAVAFALPAILVLLSNNLQLLGHDWEGQPRISLYLENKLGRDQVNRLRVEARDDPNIEQFLYISPDEGLNEFQERAQMKGVIEALGFNPLPGVLELAPREGLNSEHLNELMKKYQVKEGVMEARLDHEWIERLQSMTQLLERFTVILSVLLGIIVLLTIGNTVRLSVESRRAEIKVIKLVGGTDGFVTLPFLYMGMWYGLGGALLALLIILAVLAGLMSGVLELAALYGSSYTPVGPGFAMFFSLLASGVFLGVAGAAVSCYRHVRTIELQP
ncbi:permease-like cell division protein FtsX [Endozoicomonas sp. 8E]|uniref:permease-like cell division protein FtsX n=1 Tax=Endozoicomonas sp. 8E TaxID=3035692 RepID=UPI002939320D|nr:permease-like cell division protein FtsX [Endozoicomonas sp. 8E]WOG27160.1 permease-like cell division protein FtsX [Endozoicomonas sp. 8E]